METKIYTITDPEKDRDKIREAAEVIAAGGIVAFPTDTVYALGCDMNNEKALRKLFEVKQRPGDNPVSVLVGRDLDACLIVDITAENSQWMTRFIENYWPGPLTMIMPRISERISLFITGGGKNVAVREPNDPIALALLAECENPIAAPSANISGHPSPTSAQHVIDEFDGKIDMILAGPDCKEGVESTVLDMTESTMKIIRPGSITKEQLEEVIPRKIEVVPREISLE